MKIKITATHLLIIFFVGIFFTFVGFRSGIWLGSSWYTVKANQQWGMNTYYFLNAKDAYIFYGLISLWLGGLTAGIALPLIFLKRPLPSLIPFFFAIFLTTVGFNTLDWMLAGVIASEPGWEAWSLNLNVYLNSWNFYVLTTIFPLFLGGLFLGMSITRFAVQTKS